LDRKKFIESLGKKVESVESTEKYFDLFLVKNQDPIKDRSFPQYVLKEDGLETFKDSYYLFFKLNKMLIIVFLILTLLSIPMLVIYSQNGMKKLEKSESETETQSDNKEKDWFTFLTIGNLFEDKDRRLHRLDKSLEDVVSEIEAAEKDLEIIQEELDVPNKATKTESESEEHVPLSDIEWKLYNIYKVIYALDITTSVCFFIFLVVAFWFINKTKSFVVLETMETNKEMEGVGQNQFNFDVESSQLSRGRASRHVSPAEEVKMSFYRDLGKSIKDYTLELDIIEPSDFEFRNKQKFIYFDQKEDNIEDIESVRTNDRNTGDRSLRRNREKPRSHIGDTEQKKYQDFIQLIEENRNKSAFENFFESRFGIRVRSLRFVFDFKQSLPDFASLSESLIKRKEFKMSHLK
jgi:hypothetical protein